MLMFKDYTELAQLLPRYTAQESSPFTLPEQYRRDGPGDMGIEEPVPRAWSQRAALPLTESVLESWLCEY